MTPGMMAAFLFANVLDESGKPAGLNTLAALDGEGRPITEMMGVQFPQLSAESPLMMDEPKLNLIEDVVQDERLTEEDRARLWGARAMAVIPLKIGNRWIGSISLTWTAPRTFTDVERRLYNSLAGQAATTLDNQLLFRQTQKRAERESVINLIAQKIQSATSVEGAIQTAVRELGQAFKARRAVVELGNGEAPKNGQ
jgi:GAF domain-containing protein